MAVVVDATEKGLPVYRSINGLEVSVQERMEADRVDTVLRDGLKQIRDQHRVERTLQKKNIVYWHIGRFLRHVFKESSLPSAELGYFFINARNRMPKELQTKKRGANRDPIEYCYRIGKIPRELVQQLQWSEWSHFLDQPGINGEARFDDWMAQNIRKNPRLFERKTARYMTKCITALLKGIETKDLDDDELARCYNAALFMTQAATAELGNGATMRDLGKRTQAAIRNRIDLLAELIEGDITPQSYAQTILKPDKEIGSISASGL